MPENHARLLVVDDNENNREMLSRRLMRRGYQVALATGGAEAIAMVEAEAFDLMLLDIMMPDVSGMDVLQHVRKTKSPAELPIIMATAKDASEAVVEALRLGASDYVTKPLDFPVVVARVDTQLALKRAVDRIIALERELEKQNADLQAANTRMRQELALAARLQVSLLPAGQPMESGVRFCWSYVPCEELGGDIFNVISLGEGLLGIYLLDVSGHGVPAALLSVTLSRLLSPVADQPSLVQRMTSTGLVPTSPVEVLAQLNKRFPMNGDNQQYFTIVYGVLDTTTGRFRFSNAGHPPIVHLPAGGKPVMLEYPAMAIGWAEETEFEEHVVELALGDRLFLYSDGLIEAQDFHGVAFDTERLMEALSSAHDICTSSTHLLEALAAYRGAGRYDDDLSVLGFEFIARPTTGL